MGFITIIRSIEDLLYEIMTWLLFYPRTLWQVIRHPVQMVDYSDDEQTEGSEEQYTDTLSPPLFLMISILLAHGLEVAFNVRIDNPKAEVVRLFPNPTEGLLVIRAILSSIYPLTFAAALLKRSDRPLDRKTLRAPFFSQCYLAALFGLILAVAAVLGRQPSTDLQYAGLAVSIAGIVWYIWVQAVWFAEHLGLGRVRATGMAIGTFLRASVINAAIAAMVFA